MINQILLILLSAGYVILCVCCFAEYQHRSGAKSNSVYMPAYMFWIGLLTSLPFLVITWLAAIQDGSIGLTICFGLFTFLGMSLMLGWRNCFIMYDKSGFTQGNLLGIRRSFTYDQVTAWSCNKRNPTESSLYVGEKKISFNLASANGVDFLTTANAGYRKIHGNKKLPEMPGLRNAGGGFRAHVYNPVEYLIIFIMLVAFILGSGIWLAIEDWKPIDENDGQRYTAVFSGWKIEGDNLILSSPHMQETFIIGGYEDYVSNLAQLLKTCDNKPLFTVWGRRYDPDDAPPFFRVYALSSGDEVYLTFEAATAYKRESIPATLGIFGFFLIVVLAFSGFIYAVGSNPYKFPRWMVYACFKKNAIDF